MKKRLPPDWTPPPGIKYEDTLGPEYNEWSDEVSLPTHYREAGVELWDVLDAFGLERYAYRYMAVQYLMRAHRKDATRELVDLEKARAYLDREIKRLRGLDEELERGVG